VGRDRQPHQGDLRLLLWVPGRERRRQLCDLHEKCQLTASLFFVGSNDESLDEQLKALYLKQECAEFAVENQGLKAAGLRAQEDGWRAYLIER
jgi:hypothetical protein